MKFIAENLTVLIIQQRDFRLNITNIYSPSPENYNQMNDSSSIHCLQKTLDQPGEHVLVDDLNLHHKSWRGNQVNREHRMAADLLKQMKQSNLVLITPPGMITQDLHESKIIIDLIFVSSIIHDWLIHCQEAAELDKASDHKPIETLFYSDVKTEGTAKHRS